MSVGPRLKILITNLALDRLGGTESVVRDLRSVSCGGVTGRSSTRRTLEPRHMRSKIAA